MTKYNLMCLFGHLLSYSTYDKDNYGYHHCLRKGCSYTKKWYAGEPHPIGVS